MKLVFCPSVLALSGKQGASPGQRSRQRDSDGRKDGGCVQRGTGRAGRRRTGREALAAAGAVRGRGAGVAGAAPRRHAPVGGVCGPAAVLQAAQLRGSVPESRPQPGHLPEQLHLHLPRPHPVLHHQLPVAVTGPGCVRWRVLCHPPQEPGEETGAVWEGGHWGTPAGPGRSCVLPCVLVGWSRSSCVLGAGCNAGCDWVSRSLP